MSPRSTTRHLTEPAGDAQVSPALTDADRARLLDALAPSAIACKDCGAVLSVPDGGPYVFDPCEVNGTRCRIVTPSEVYLSADLATSATRAAVSADADPPARVETAGRLRTAAGWLALFAWAALITHCAVGEHTASYEHPTEEAR